MNLRRAQGLLAEMRRDGLRLSIVASVVGDRVSYAPASLASPEIVDRIRENKNALLLLLRHRRDGLDGEWCPACNGVQLWLGQSGLTWNCIECSPPTDPAQVAVCISHEGDDVVLEFNLPRGASGSA
jgi:hypothetical protein